MEKKSAGMTRIMTMSFYALRKKAGRASGRKGVSGAMSKSAARIAKIDSNSGTTKENISAPR